MWEWQKWCKLCAKQETEQCPVDFESYTKLAFIIQKYFAVALSDCDVNNICLECKQFLMTLDQYSERCIRVNTMFGIIISSNEHLQLDPIYLQNLRDNAALDNDVKCYQFGADKIEKSTDTDDLSTMSVKTEATATKPTVRKRKRNTRARKKPKKVEPILDVKDEEFEMDVFDNDNDDDFENDPTFSLNCDDAQETAKLFDEDYQQIISNTELIDLNITPRRKRKKLPITEDKQYNCPVCEIVIENKRLLDAHMREYHRDEENPFGCTKCFKRFGSITKLKRHESVHLPEELKLIHQCSICPKRFSKLVNVQAHIRAIHTGERSFICEECGKSFVAKGALKEHQITHSNEYPFKCTVSSHCQKRFKTSARLRTHEDIHNQTTYICPHCGLQLNTKRTLKMHLVVHSNNKPFKCEFCGNEFKRSKALKNHLILHTGLRPYVCPWCEKSFANGSNCRSHKKKAHPVELAQLEASGEVLPSANIPKLENLQPKKTSMSDTMNTITAGTNNILIITQADEKIIENIVYTTT